MQASRVTPRGLHLIELRSESQGTIFINGFQVISVVGHPRTGRAIVALATGEKLQVDHDPREVADALVGETGSTAVPVSKTFARPKATPYRR